MAAINCEGMPFDELNALVRESKSDITLENCLGQRFIASAQKNRTITIRGTPGNALGS